LAQKIADHKGYDLGQIEIHTFPDNENRVRVISDVLDQDVVVVQSTGISPNLYYMELFFILDSLKRSGARRVTLVIPYLGYQRQDHVFRSGEGVSLEVIIKILESLGVDRFISFEFHSVKISELFKKEVRELSAIPLFAKKINSLATPHEIINHKSSIINHELVLVSPDMGGIARIKKISEELGGVPYVTVEKDRDLVTGDIKSLKFTGGVKKTAVIVDDVISTGKTLIASADLLTENGAEEVYAMSTHGAFAGDAPQEIQNSNIKKVIVTDTIEIPENRKFGKLEIISVADMIAEELKGATSH